MFLTKRQREILQFIERFLNRNGYSPSLEEIAKGLNLKSISTVHKHLSNLESKGLIRRHWNRGRSIELTAGASSRQVAEVPLFGEVAAGNPIEAIENGDSIGLPQDLVRGESTFVLRVSGDSMADESICDGDYIICERRATARDGETVVALVKPENNVTVKIFFREGNSVRLQPSNDSMLPMVFPAEDIEIQAVVIGLLRKY
jgi:repressor LexA